MATQFRRVTTDRPDHPCHPQRHEHCTPPQSAPHKPRAIQPSPTSTTNPVPLSLSLSLSVPVPFTPSPHMVTGTDDHAPGDGQSHYQYPMDRNPQPAASLYPSRTDQAGHALAGCLTNGV